MDYSDKLLILLIGSVIFCTFWISAYISAVIRKLDRIDNRLQGWWEEYIDKGGRL